MTIINLTQHTINETTTGQAFPPSGRVARVKSSTRTAMTFDGIPVYQSEFGDVEGLPPRKKDVRYIVSALTLNEVPRNRTDVVAPGNIQRDERGNRIGCCGFRTR